MTVWLARRGGASSEILRAISGLSDGGAGARGGSMCDMARERGIAGYSRADEGYRGGVDSGAGGTRSVRGPRLMDEVRRVLRLKHYSVRTEAAYVGWIVRFIRANGRR